MKLTYNCLDHFVSLIADASVMSEEVASMLLGEADDVLGEVADFILDLDGEHHDGRVHRENVGGIGILGMLV